MRNQVSLELIRPTKLAHTVRNRALKLLNGIVHQLMSLQFVSPIECRLADDTDERLESAVDDTVHLQVGGRLEGLLAVGALEGRPVAVREVPLHVRV